VNFPQDSPLHVRSLIFLLNYISRYRDLCIHDLLEAYVPLYTTDYIWAMGVNGPFGRVFAENDKKSAPFIWKHYSWSYFPQLKTQPTTLPVQCDGYNCGIFVLYNIMDLVLTQWDKVSVISDLVVAGLEASPSNALATWMDIIGLCKFARLPSWYSIGTAFVLDPSSANKNVYKTICDFMRLEMVVLMERLHCIYYDTFSQRDTRLKWWVFGSLRDFHVRAVKNEPCLEYIHCQRFREFQWPTLEQLNDVRYAYAAPKAFIMGVSIQFFRNMFMLMKERMIGCWISLTTIALTRCATKLEVIAGQMKH
jgi:hypothetical protein